MSKDRYEYISTLQTDRFRHTVVIGQSGSGKSNITNQLVQRDIESDCGLFHVDLDGTDTDTILKTVPKRRIKDVVLLDLADTDYPVAINPFVGTGSHYDATIADLFVDTFRSIWSYEDAATPDMDRTIYNATRAVLDLPQGTILSMYRMLVSYDARAKIIPSIQDEIVAQYWKYDFGRLDKRDQTFITKSTVNKLERFVSDIRIRNILGQKKPLFEFLPAIQSRKIVLLKIPTATFGQSKARTIAGLLLAQFYGVAQQQKGFIPFHIYLPECQHFAGDMLGQMLSTLGKRNFSITLTCQYLEQLGKLRPAVFGNVGSWVIFRVGLTDALKLEELFEWDNTRKFLYELDQFEARIMTPTTPPTTALTMFLNRETRNFSKHIVKYSRHFYARASGRSI